MIVGINGKKMDRWIIYNDFYSFQKYPTYYACYLFEDIC